MCKLTVIVYAPVRVLLIPFASIMMKRLTSMFMKDGHGMYISGFSIDLRE